MSENDNRLIARDSLFVMVDLRVEGDELDHRVKLRNLSAGGMMAEGMVKVTRGTLVSVHIRNLGWVDGSVAWVQGNRFGIAFQDEIDPKIARIPATSTSQLPPQSEAIRRHVAIFATQSEAAQRKI